MAQIAHNIEQLLEQMDQYMDVKSFEKIKNDQAEKAYFLREKGTPKLRPLMRPDIKAPVDKKKVTWMD